MIYARRPKPKQTINCVVINGQQTGLQLTTNKGCLLLFFDEDRISLIREAVGSEAMPMTSFISDALEVYCFTAEQAFCFPEFPKRNFTVPGREP